MMSDVGSATTLRGELALPTIRIEVPVMMMPGVAPISSDGWANDSWAPAGIGWWGREP